MDFDRASGLDNSCAATCNGTFTCNYLALHEYGDDSIPLHTYMAYIVYLFYLAVPWVQWS